MHLLNRATQRLLPSTSSLVFRGKNERSDGVYLKIRKDGMILRIFLTAVLLFITASVVQANDYGPYGNPPYWTPPRTLSPNWKMEYEMEQQKRQMQMQQEEIQRMKTQMEIQRMEEEARRNFERSNRNSLYR